MIGMKLFPCGRWHASLFSLLMLGALLPACRKNEAPAAAAAPAAPVAPAAAPVPEPTPAPVAVAAPAAPAVNLDKVQGEWMRKDGGYRLVIGAIGAEGHAKGEYFNPNPIKVAWTRVRAEGGVIKVDLELRDTNYPGCLYKLTYDAAGDRLVGTYFQAQMQETYDIEFARQP